jgi:hypothetical protein
MTIEQVLKEAVREVIREELQSLDRDDKLLTAEQAAEKLGYTNVESVRRLARDGHLEPVNLGENTRRYRNSDVQRLVQQGIQ